MNLGWATVKIRTSIGTEVSDNSSP